MLNNIDNYKLLCYNATWGFGRKLPNCIWNLWRVYMYKRICSGLLSLALTFGVSTKQSDASLIGGTLRIIGGTIFWGTAAICNIPPIVLMVCSESAEEKKVAAGGWVAFNIIGLYGYVPGGLICALGRLCDLGDNKKDDAEEKRRQAEEKRRQEEHEILMAKYRKELKELEEKKHNIESSSKV